MRRRPGRAIRACTLVFVCSAVSCIVSCGSRSEQTEVGVWFEPVRFSSAELGGAVTPADLKVIESVARAEIARAFAGLQITISNRRDAPYRVQIVERLRDPRFRSEIEVAGASWSLSGGGGRGAVSFRFLASGAVAEAPPEADRAARIEAIGRGIGRSVVHELVHQFFPSAPIHSQDAQSYEFDSAARRVQYYGDMHWSVARPLLLARFSERPGPSRAR